MRPIYIVEEEQYAAQIQSNFDANHFKFCKHYDESEIECKMNRKINFDLQLIKKNDIIFSVPRV